ncbi:MAG TPA: hypothetical protein H9717_02060 [Candidatus Eisenbergiella merdipullorum]|uniref:Uncharacterized protein n=1 Tax=Candidatus Eisenbergiella merdipullorum TaxID=2838553 RepID=A0A9D2I4H1_9FIRM|nr:hypothetical protein [Candidatus Eisenbergiella merdipullorum]
MAEQYDGSIRINTEINTRDVNSQMLRLTNEIKKTAKEISVLQEKMESLGKTKIPTAEYAEIQKQIADAESRMNKLIASQDRFLSIGGKESSSTYKRMQYDIDELANTVKYATGELRDLEETGKAFIPGTDTAEYAKMAQQVENLNDKLAVSNRRLEEMKQKQQPVEQSYNRMKNAADQMSKTVKKVGDNTKKSFSTAAAQTNKMTKSVNKAHMGFGRMLAMSVAFSAVFRAISAITSGVGQGFTNLMGYSSQFAENVQSLKNALTTLGNAFATAFAPIISMVIPALNALISALSTAMTYVAQFVAILGGNSTFIRAKKVQDSYNDSLNGTASAAKKATGALAKFDDLDVLQKQDDSGGGGAGTDVGGMFEEVPVDPALVKWLDGLKAKLKPILDYAKELKDAFTQGFWDGLGDYEYRFEAIKKGLEQIKDALIDIWTDPAVLAAADGWAKSFMYMLGSLVGSVASIGLTIATAFIGGLGQYLEDNTDRIKKYLISMFNVGADINMLLADLFQSVAYIFEAFASESGIRFMAALIGVIADSAMGVTEIALKIGRDFLQMLVLPITENADAFKTALEGLLGSAATVLEGYKSMIDSVFDNLNEVYDTKFKPFFDSVANGLASLVGTFLEVWNGQIQPILDSVAAKLYELFSSYIAPLINSIITLIGGLVSILQTFWETILMPLIEWVITYVVPVVGEAIGLLLEIIIQVIMQITEAITGIINFINGTIIPLWQAAWNSAGVIFQAFFNVLNALGQLMKDFFSGLLKFIKQVVVEKDWKGAWETAKEFFANFKDNILELVEKIQEFFKIFVEWIGENVLEIWKSGWAEAQEKFESFKNGIINAISPIIDKLREFIDWVRNAIQAVRDFFSSGAGSVGSSGSITAGYSVSANSLDAQAVIRNVPHLASGAVIRGGSPFLALLGDQRAGQMNVETPVSTIEDALRNVMNERDEVRSVTVNLNYDGETFARLSLNDIFSEAARQGYDVDMLGWQG